MHAALVKEWGEIPNYVETEAPVVPSADSDIVQIEVKAVGLHQLVKTRASGKHFSAKTLPHVVGSDGVGVTTNGQLVYFSTFFTGGSFADVVNVPKKDVTPMPEGLDIQQAAALVNPATSSWMALQTRTFGLPTGFTVLILGATGASGSLAISNARALGAGKVIGCARNESKLSGLDLDEVVVLQDPVEATDFSEIGDVDVILDYVYGSAAAHLLSSLNSTRPVQYVHIGGLGGEMDMSLPGAILRSKDITIRGSAPGSFAVAQLGTELPKLLDAMKGMKAQELNVVPLSGIQRAWNENEDRRTVFVI